MCVAHFQNKTSHHQPTHPPHAITYPYYFYLSIGGPRPGLDGGGRLPHPRVPRRRLRAGACVHLCVCMCARLSIYVSVCKRREGVCVHISHTYPLLSLQTNQHHRHPQVIFGGLTRSSPSHTLTHTHTHCISMKTPPSPPPIKYGR